MRIASLVPSSTELLFALGLGDAIVAVTHECDYPPAARQLPQLTRSVVPEGLSASGIDAAVRERTQAGLALYELDEQRLAGLEPDLIVTQAVCEVCAVSYDDVVAAAGRLASRPRVISLDPSTLDEVLGDVPRLAEAAQALLEDAAARIGSVGEAVAGAPRPRVAALEWLDPIFVGGHWVPQMIDLAGGEDVLGHTGARSRTAEWAELKAAAPELVVSMPCGYATQRAREETQIHAQRLRDLGARVAAVDASSYFSRPGPRLVDGIELLAHLLHPDRVGAPSGNRFAWLALEHPATT